MNMTTAARPVIPARPARPALSADVAPHWLAAAAVRAGLPGADVLDIPVTLAVADAWRSIASGLALAQTDLATRVAPTLRVAVADFDRADPRALRLVPEKLARRLSVFPLREDDRTIVIASADPNDLETENTISFAAGRKVAFELGSPDAIETAITNAYAPDSLIERLLSSVDERIADSVHVVQAAEAAKVTTSEVEAEPVVKLTNLVLRDAVTSGASDIHIEPGPKGGVVRFRIDGIMRVHLELPVATLNRIVSRIKVLSKLDIADRLRPQDGRTRIEVDRKAYDLRVSTVPTRDAEKAVIRVLRPDTTSDLAGCNITRLELNRIRRLIAQRDGIVIVTGPTGSGKTTTLYSAIKELADGDINLMTVEDPIEYELPGITQMQVEAKREVTFPSALRAILRQDPDVILIGEIRDKETAMIAAQAALTGHLVLATLHTNDAIGAVARLTDLGLDRATIASALRGVIAQRLVRSVCRACGGNAVAAGDAACTTCGGTGYKGRVPVHEVALVTPDLAEAINAGASAGALTQIAKTHGMRLMREVVATRVAAGETTTEEADRVFGELGDDTPAESQPSEHATTKVLVVDDDPVMRHTISALLTGIGFEAECVEDGEVALARVAQGGTWDLILTDLDMPKVGGEALIASLRRTGRTAATPIIVLTGSSSDATEISAMDAGADDYVRKPVEPARFLARVRATLRRAAA
jgi:type II secretory ATPase GspE/PulE/Tfp pilus assembly ATPase PilB-like protein/ActR/RegA family two-component response regulator